MVKLRRDEDACVTLWRIGLKAGILQAFVPLNNSSKHKRAPMIHIYSMSISIYEVWYAIYIDLMNDDGENE